MEKGEPISHLVEEVLGRRVMENKTASCYKLTVDTAKQFTEDLFICTPSPRLVGIWNGNVDKVTLTIPETKALFSERHWNNRRKTGTGSILFTAELREHIRKEPYSVHLPQLLF